MSVIFNSRRDFTLKTYRSVAWHGEPVEIGHDAHLAMCGSRDRFDTLIEDPDVMIYGVTTGYAQHAGKLLSVEERRAQAAASPTAPNVAWGEALPTRVVRGVIFARLANFIEGHAAISPQVAIEVAAMLDGRELPAIPIQGQGGAGEILALSPLFGGLADRVTLAEKDALSLINGAPAAAALTADAALAHAARLELAVTIFALAIEAFGASTDAYDEEFEALWNDPDDAWALRELRAAMAKERKGGTQAPASFRAVPRLIGQMRRATRQATEAAEIMLGAVTDNPVILGNERVLSNGGFHSAHAPAAMDALTAAAAGLCVLVSRLSTRLAEMPGFGVSNRPDGLTPYTFMPMAILGYEEELRALATATLPPGGEGGGYGVNDLASPIFPAWSKQERAGCILECTLAALTIITLREGSLPPVLKHLSLPVNSEHSQIDKLGQTAANMADQFRGRVYGWPNRLR